MIGAGRRHAACLAGTALVTMLLAPRPAAGGAPATDACDRTAFERAVNSAWDEIVSEAIAARGVSVVGEDADAETARRVYRDMALQLTRDPRILCFLTLDQETRQRYVSERSNLNREIVARSSSLARSLDAASTNPARVGLVERSGFTDLVGIALQGANLVAADETAVTINLNAIGLFGGGKLDREWPSAKRYRAQGWLNRLGGSLTFGAQVPRRELAGFAGLPDADELLDVLVWDVKLRVVGDRDPRAPRWDDMLLGRLGGVNWVRTNALGSPRIPIEHARAGGPLNQALEELIDASVGDVSRSIRRSLQLSLKFSGQHLTRQAGLNKFSGVLLLDKGWGGFDLSANAAYAAVQDVPLAPDLSSSLKSWRIAVAGTGTVWKDAIVDGRGTELALSAETVVPADGRDAPVNRKTTWRADVALKLPLTEKLQLPFSVTYTSDPNQLAKQSFVRGRIGVHYDFGSLRKLAAGG